MRYVVLALALACLSFYGEAQDVQQNRARNFYSSEKEAALGAQLSMQVRRQTTPLGLVDVDRYVNELGRELAAQMPNAPEGWKFSLIIDRQDSSTYEPISLPGGWVFIPAQLVLASNSEGEFAGMLAHAMAHVAERQGTRQMPGDVAQLATIPLVFTGAAVFGGDRQNGFVPVGYLKIQRRYELEADEVAVKTMSAAGFNPNDLLNYIARVQPEHTALSKELSPLPSSAVRISNLKHAIQALATSRTRESSHSFQLIQDEVRRDETRRQHQMYPIPSLRERR